MDDSNKKLTIVIKDDDGNVLIEIKDGQCLISRFKNIDNDLREKIIELFIDLTDMNRKEVIDFMEFNETEQRFCS